MGTPEVGSEREDLHEIYKDERSRGQRSERGCGRGQDARLCLRLSIYRRTHTGVAGAAGRGNRRVGRGEGERGRAVEGGLKAARGALRKQSGGQDGMSW